MRVFQITGAIMVLHATAARAQHEAMSAAHSLRLGAHAVGLLTRVSPAIHDEALTEGYLTQPGILAHGSLWGGRLVLTGTANLEGLTLKRGELDHGVWGEGYIDRRHPHTYVHEAVATVRARVVGTGISLSAGRGFAPFGTDDPMVRPFVRFPSNHHLSQILERIVAVGAVRGGPLALEFGTFNGDEPTGPTDLGRLSRFADSWAARGTIAPIEGVELQGSYAAVTSPEQPWGGGLDQDKRNFSLRVERSVGPASLYALIEKARTAEGHGSIESFVFTSTLAEAAVHAYGWGIAARYENSLRPEEERLSNQFRSVRPSTDNSILGVTRWRTWTANVGRAIRHGKGVIEPFIEVSRSHATSLHELALFRPEDFYGSTRIWSLSGGVRLDVGMQHHRMGRYGVARND